MLQFIKHDKTSQGSCDVFSVYISRKNDFVYFNLAVVFSVISPAYVLLFTSRMSIP